MADGSVLLVGAGRMGSVLLKGWLASGCFAEIRVIEPSPSRLLRTLAQENKIVWETQFDNAVVGHLDVAVLALKPDVLKTQTYVMGILGQRSTLVLSIAAGVPTKFIQDAVGPTGRIVRAMPNTPGAIGHGITALYGAALSDADKRLAERLVSALGPSLWLADESLMDAVTALSGSGPAYVFLLVEALAKAGVEQGLDADTAARLARATVSGGGALLCADPRSVEALRKEVASPGGTTEAALGVLMGEGGLVALITRAVAAAMARAKELGR